MSDIKGSLGTNSVVKSLKSYFKIKLRNLKIFPKKTGKKLRLTLY